MTPPTTPAIMAGFAVRAFCRTVFACVILGLCNPAFAQAGSGCGNGYRVIANRWDAVLRMNWELRQNCAHPEWPAQSAVTGSIAPHPVLFSGLVIPSGSASILQPLLVHAGEQVRLWMEDGPVRIQITGVADRSARNGEQVFVQVPRQSDEAGLAVQRISGIVRGAGSVEMER